MTLLMRKFTIEDTKSWDQLEDKQVFGGGVIDRSYGYRMSAMYWRIGAEEEAPVPAPYDEVWIVVQGAVSIRAEDEAVPAMAGEVLLVSEGTPGTAHFQAETELLTVAYPPSWEIWSESWEAMTKQADADRPKRFSFNVPAGSENADKPMATAKAAERPNGFRLDVALERFGAETPPIPLGGTDGRDVIVAVVVGSARLLSKDDELILHAGEFAYLPGGEGELAPATSADVVLVRERPQ